MSFTATKGHFLKNGKPHFVISGEIHYFRVDPKLWEKHLTLLKQSGANTTSTYTREYHKYDYLKHLFPRCRQNTFLFLSAQMLL